MWWKIALLVLVVPTIDFLVLLQIGSWLGPMPTFLLVLLSGGIGAWLAKREGLTVLRALSEDMQRGLPPADRLAEGALVLLGAVLLITPGVLTDVVGLAILIPPVRRRLAPRVVRSLSSGFGLDGPEEEPLADGLRYRREGAPRAVDPPTAGVKPTPFSTPFD